MQQTLFDRPEVPPGFEYRPDFLSEEEERALREAMGGLEFRQVAMRGGIARRRTVHYGYDYGYERRRTTPGEPMPKFLLPARQRAAAWAGVEAEAFAEALVTEYPAGAPIGWHRDAPMFDVIVGISLGSSCRMKFRPYVSPSKAGPALRRTTHEIVLEPRSAYLIRGVARREYEHSIPPVEALRYSITFRTLR